MEHTSYEEKKPIAGLRWLSVNSALDLRTDGFVNPDIVWPVREPLKFNCVHKDDPCSNVVCTCDSGSYFYSSALNINDNDQRILTGVVGWGDVIIDKNRWFAEYTQAIVLFEHQDLIRSSVMKISEKYILPVQLIKEGGIELFESAEVNDVG